MSVKVIELCGLYCTRLRHYVKMICQVTSDTRQNDDKQTAQTGDKGKLKIEFGTFSMFCIV